MSTIRDVASAAGVSLGTASRALSGHPAVLPETRERVRLVASELNYRADPVARALRAGNSNLLALIVSNLQNPAIQQIAETVQTLGQTEGFEVVIATTNDDGDRERRLIETLSDRRVDGLIAMSSGENIDLLNSLYASGMPLVELIRLPTGTESPSVVYDDLRAGSLATVHLLGLGHRRIGFLGGPAETRSGEQRYVGFETAHHEAGVQVHDELVARGPFSAAFGVEGVERLLAATIPPTALVIANHEAMFSALQAINRAGIAIPTALSVVAIEDDPLLAWWHPAISSIDVRPIELATQAVNALIAQIRGTAPEARSSAGDGVALLLRESTAAAHWPNPT